MHCTSISGGFGVGCSTVITGIPGMERYEEKDLFGYYPGSDTYHMFSVTNAGETHDHSGKLTSDAFIGRYEGVRDGKPFVENISFKFTGDNELTVTSTVMENGQPAESLHAVLER